MLCDASCCTACAACISACPKHCVRFAADPDAHTRPVVDESSCVHCGLCEKACPVLYPPQKRSVVYPEVFCAKSRDPELLRRSASGGVATELTGLFITEKKGYACGVTTGEDHIPYFVLLDGDADPGAVSGSRYVHSRADGIYPKVKACLEQRQEVFFCGLPCQVAALYAFLGKTYDTLYTADIVCHGCADEAAYQSYLAYLQKVKGEKIVRIEHTSKDRGWSVLIQKLLKIQFESGDVQYRWSQQDPYLSLFLDGSIYMPACYDCRFSRLPRVGDLTLGDFFGIGAVRRIRRPGTDGVSMVMVNTEQGRALWDTLSPRLWTEQRDLREVVYLNLNVWRPSAKSGMQPALEQAMRDPDWAQITSDFYDTRSAKRDRTLRRIIKAVFGDRNTARLMLAWYRLNGTTAKADEALRELRERIGNATSPDQSK